MKKLKLFHMNQRVSAEPIDRSIVYEDFLKNHYSLGLRQVIITSRMMIKLVEFFVQENDFQIERISFAKEDWEVREKMKRILNTIKKNRIFLDVMLEWLRESLNDSSIEITEIRFGKIAQAGKLEIVIRANGVIEINDSFSEDMLNEISSLIERCLFS